MNHSVHHSGLGSRMQGVKSSRFLDILRQLAGGTGFQGVGKTPPRVAGLPVGVVTVGPHRTHFDVFPVPVVQ
ncbi:hypothetical protein AN220_12945 [Streptomyces nanshensis]|nr:hypothetical protein AN220_12945 [Streptomyces nanshensis]